MNGDEPADLTQELARATPPLSRVPAWLIRWGTAAWMLIGIFIVAAVAYLGLARISTLVAPLVVAVVMGMLFHQLVDRLERSGVGRELIGERIPAAAHLKRFDLGEVVAPNDDVRRVGPAQSLANRLVHGALVLDRRLPAHPA